MEDFKLGQKLYAPTKTGNVKTWSASTTYCANDCAKGAATIIIVTQTKLNGKEVVRYDNIPLGKNIGKSNETTPHEQAISEAKSRYRKKMDQGYETEIPTDLTKANNNSMGFPKPMLAHPIDKVKLVEFPAYFQPKLDGHRAIVTKKDGKMVMYSRQGKPINSMGHILDHLEKEVDEGVFLDGELYLHGVELQSIGSLIKKKQTGSENVTYHVYDIMVDAPYMDRWNRLRAIVGIANFTPARLVPTMITHSMEEAQIFTEDAIKEGYEGGILRTPDEGYLAGFRSRQLLKIKKFDDSEHTIVDVVEGKDRLCNDVQLKVACFICETPDGKRFEVTAHGDMHQKDRIWHERKQHIGKLVTIKHSGYTKDGIPWHPICLRFREDV